MMVTNDRLIKNRAARALFNQSKFEFMTAIRGAYLASKESDMMAETGD